MVIYVTQWSTGVTSARIDAFYSTSAHLIRCQSTSLGLISAITVLCRHRLQFSLKLDIRCVIRFGTTPTSDKHFTSQENRIPLLRQYRQTNRRNEIREGHFPTQTQQRNIMKLIPRVSGVLRMWYSLRNTHIDIRIIAVRFAISPGDTVWIGCGVPIT